MGLNNYQAFFFHLNKRIISICCHVKLLGSTQLWSVALTEVCLLQIKVLITFLKNMLYSKIHLGPILMRCGTERIKSQIQERPELELNIKPSSY